MRRRARRALALAGALALLPAAARAGGPPTPVDPAARLPRGDEAWEQWDLAAHFDSGDRIYARVLITNQGPGEHTAAAFGSVVTRDGHTTAFSNGRRQGRWQLAAGGRRIDIGSSLLDFGEREQRFEVDNDKRGVKLHVALPGDAPGLAAPPGPAGAQLDLLQLSSPARGSLWLAGMDAPRPLVGRALLTHAWGTRQQTFSLRSQLATLGSTRGLFVADGATRAGGRWSWAVSAGEDGSLTPHPDVRVESRPADKLDEDYPLPAGIDVRGKDLNASFALKAAPVLVSDPLDALPSLVRMVYSLAGRPRHIWADATAHVALGPRGDDPEESFESAGIAVFFFSDATP